MTEISEKKKIKILYYGDFLRSTGFGNVAMSIIERLLKTGDYEFEALGINYSGDPINLKESRYYPFKDIPVWPAVDMHESGMRDFFGRRRLIKLLVDRKYDLFFTIQDSFNMMWLPEHLSKLKEAKEKEHENFKYVLYFPVDGDLRKEWVEKGVKASDKPITYTQYGVNSVKEIDDSINTACIPHGVDTAVFKPFEKESDRDAFREEYFGKDNKDSFIFINVNRNQPRKDMARTLIAFSEFVRRNPESKAILYMHCHPADAAGINLIDVCRGYLSKEVLSRIKFPDSYMMGNDGYPVEMVANLYAASDLLLTTSLGEGWGLSTTEAMACGTPVLTPDHTALREIVGENEERGYLIPDKGDFVIFTNDNGLKRPVVNVEAMVEKMEYIYKNREEAKEKAKKAFSWIQDYSWDKIVEKWDAMFKEIYKSLNK